MREIGSLTPVPIRELWPNEAADLTPWLAGNPDLLGEALGMDLELVDTEVAVGPFSADILFRAGEPNALVVVENMMGSTDHDHLGKTITYASGLEAAHEEDGLDATYAVLLAERFRPEHRTALTWLNMHTKKTVGFFGVAIEGWRIDDSLPAPKVNVVVRPDDWAREVRPPDETSLYRAFWSAFRPGFELAHPGWTPSHKLAGRKRAWATFPSTRTDVEFTAGFSGRERGFKLECVTKGAERQRLHHELHERRSEIESTFGEALDWRENSEKDHRWYIFAWYPDREVGIADRGRWPEVREWAIKRLGDLRDAIQPHLDELASDGG